MAGNGFLPTVGLLRRAEPRLLIVFSLRTTQAVGMGAILRRPAGQPGAASSVWRGKVRGVSMMPTVPAVSTGADPTAGQGGHLWAVASKVGGGVDVGDVCH